MGYYELKHWLKHCIKQLEVSRKSKVSMCTYLYVWSNKCKHCNYNNDMKVLNYALNKRYKK
jgi:hypothetical protein